MTAPVLITNNVNSFQWMRTELSPPPRALPRKRVRCQAVPDVNGKDNDNDEPPPPPQNAGSGPSTSSSDSEARVGALYEPRTLPDYTGHPCFQLERKKLLQHDVRDLNNKLIHPKDYWSALRPGTLLLIKATLHVSLVKGTSGGRHRKIYQINVVSTKVLAESPLPALPLPVHAGPTTTADSNIEGAADDGFDSFAVPTGVARAVSPWEAAHSSTTVAGPAEPKEEPTPDQKPDVKGKGKAVSKTDKRKYNKRGRDLDDMEVEEI
ncbi:hypothetical protein FA13DRAFT_1709932 [Coprinellus micaceus]|uniref:Uncharacterized protein n=1 Tax=Coprinellus micaceus TaxID=71717 RepID=A0A4Y7TA89_COPMI|nr:hypothetical protein FA13DRAFT_1709932 [Coprinellus micaceus]